MPRRSRKPVHPKTLLLDILRAAQGELISSRELKERIGPGWKDALAELRKDGYSIEEAIGASNNRSFRLSQEQPASPQYLTEPMPAPAVTPVDRPELNGDVVCTVHLKVRDIRQILRAQATLSAEALDELAGMLASVRRRYDDANALLG